MKKTLLTILLVICVCAFCFSFSACSQNLSSDKTLRRAWSEFNCENFTYSISNNGETVGSLVTSIKPIENGYELTHNQTMNNGDTNTGTVIMKNIGSFAFPPAESTRTATINGTTFTQKIIYNGNSITYLHADGNTIPEGTNGDTVNISAPYYDNMMFYTVIRGATFNNKYNLSFNVYVPNENAVVKINTALSSTENLTYRLAGTESSTECQLVNLVRSQRISGEPLKAYYAVNDIDVGENSIKQALVKFIEGDYTYSLIDISVI